MEMKENLRGYLQLLPLKIKGRDIDCKNKRNSIVSRKGNSD